MNHKVFEDAKLEAKAVKCKHPFMKTNFDDKVFAVTEHCPDCGVTRKHGRKPGRS